MHRWLSYTAKAKDHQDRSVKPQADCSDWRPVRSFGFLLYLHSSVDSGQMMSILTKCGANRSYAAIQHSFPTGHTPTVSSDSWAQRKRRRRRKRPHQPDSRQVLLMTLVYLEQIDVQALANTQNHFNIMESERRRFVRVTCSVYSPEGRQNPRKWRVTIMWRVRWSSLWSVAWPWTWIYIEGNI